MGKGSDFERIPRDFYPPLAAVAPLIPTKSSADQALPETAIRSSGALAGSRQDTCIPTKAASPAASVTGSIIHHACPDNRIHLAGIYAAASADRSNPVD